MKYGVFSNVIKSPYIWTTRDPTYFIYHLFLSTFPIQPQDFWVPIAIKTSSTFYCPRDVSYRGMVGGASVSRKPSHCTCTHIRAQYRLSRFMFILTLENGNGRIFSVSYRIIECINVQYTTLLCLTCEWLHVYYCVENINAFSCIPSNFRQPFE